MNRGGEMKNNAKNQLLIGFHAVGAVSLYHRWDENTTVLPRLRLEVRSFLGAVMMLENPSAVSVGVQTHEAPEIEVHPVATKGASALVPLWVRYLHILNFEAQKCKKKKL